MIIVKLWGGLGNQMFQYATARRLAIKHKTEVGLDLSWFSLTNNQDSTRFFELDSFKLKKNVIEHPEDLDIIPYRPGRLGTKNIISRKYRSPDTYILYREQQYSLNKPVLRAPNNTYLEGNWTTEKYFIDIRPKVLHDFSWREKPTIKNREIISELKMELNSVSLHIRRGDFLNKTTFKHHGILGLDYYYQAECAIKKTVDKPHFYIFSDDIGWVKNNLRLKSQMSFVSHDRKGTDDMCIMKECKHAIIANSTFSWWAAWLNTNPGKVVIAPKMWLAEPNVNTSDVIPSNWKKI